MLCMKFTNNEIITNPLKFIEGLISRMFEFELAKTAFYIDSRSPFTQMLNRFDHLDQLVIGLDL